MTKYTLCISGNFIVKSILLLITHISAASEPLSNEEGGSIVLYYSLYEEKHCIKYFAAAEELHDSKRGSASNIDNINFLLLLEYEVLQ